MGYWSNLATSVKTATPNAAINVDARVPAHAVPASNPDRRRPYRQKVRNLAYISWDSENRGVLRDLSESGAAIQVLVPPRLNEQIRFRLDLSNPRARVEGDGRVAWTDSLGQAGMEFLDVPQRSRRLLKEWLLTQVLADAQRVAGDPAAGLLFSFTSRPAIRLEPAKSQRRLPLLWFRVPVDRFARLVDCLALLCAVLLFNVMAITMTDTLPSWPIAVAVVFGVAAVFVALYWFLFSLWFGITPGHRLAELACHESVAKRKREVRARFR
ncbi:MAG: PilZ domain-containing protein [Terriglobales bacterium]